MQWTRCCERCWIAFWLHFLTHWRWQSLRHNENSYMSQWTDTLNAGMRILCPLIQYCLECRRTSRVWWNHIILETRDDQMTLELANEETDHHGAVWDACSNLPSPEHLIQKSHTGSEGEILLSLPTRLRNIWSPRDTQEGGESGVYVFCALKFPTAFQCSRYLTHRQ